MDALELLENDHQKVLGMLEKLEQTTERAVKTRDETFARLRDELEAHAHVEENIFYPAVRNESKSNALTFAAYEQHHVAKILLDELGGLPVDSERWTAKLKVLKDSVEHHIEEEREQIFAEARSSLTQAQLDDLGEQMDAEKTRFQESPRSSSGREDDADARSARSSSRATFRGTGRGDERGAGRDEEGRGGQRRARGGRPSASVQVGCPGIFGNFFRRICG